nr:protein unc-80 homolog [Lytechinus pictus]
MVKRKKSGEDPKDLARQIPLPIQIFLWRQTSPFIRPKLTRIYEASCVSFERVLVENKVHGLSPSLSDAIASIPRWQLIQAALPHLMHCCAALLTNRAKLGHADKLGVGETKLLYTLHWVLLDAPDECAQETSNDDNQSDTCSQLALEHPLTTLQLFVYLFAPLVYSIKESDLTFRLESGVKLWRALWDHKQPDIQSMSGLVKPRRIIRVGRRHHPKKVSPVMNKVAPKLENKIDEVEEKKKEVIEEVKEEKKDEEKEHVEEKKEEPKEEQHRPIVPLADISEVSRLSTPADVPSVSLEIFCEMCNTPVTGNQACSCGNLKVSSGFNYAQLQDGLRAIQNRKDSEPNIQMKMAPKCTPVDFTPPPTRKSRPQSLELSGSNSSSRIEDETYDDPSKGVFPSPPSPPPEMPRRRFPQRLNDVCSATLFDVAVLRCLFSPHWSEDGVHWALTYILTRLRQIADETIAAERVRQRSNSSPIPQITVSLFNPAPGPPPKKFSVPAAYMGSNLGQGYRVSEVRPREAHPFQGSPKKIKLEEQCPPTHPPPKRNILDRKNSLERKNSGERKGPHDMVRAGKYRKVARPSKAGSALVPKLEEIEEVKMSNSSDDSKHEESTGDTKPLIPSPEEVVKNPSFTIPRREPLEFKIKVIHLKTLPSLLKVGEHNQDNSPNCNSNENELTESLLKPLQSNIAFTASAATLDITKPLELPAKQTLSNSPTMLTASYDRQRTSVLTPPSSSPGINSLPNPTLKAPVMVSNPRSKASALPRSPSPRFVTTVTPGSPSSSPLPPAPAGHGSAPAVHAKRLIKEAGGIQDRKPMQLHGPNAQVLQVPDWNSADLEPQMATIIEPPKRLSNGTMIQSDCETKTLPKLTIPPLPLSPSAKPPPLPLTGPPPITPPPFCSPPKLSPPKREQPKLVKAVVIQDEMEDLSDWEMTTTHNNNNNPHSNPDYPPPSDDDHDIEEPTETCALLVPPPRDTTKNPFKPADNCPSSGSECQGSQKTSLNIPASILPRSASDTFVNYTTQEEQEVAEAPGSTYYIQENGHLNFSVIVKALHTIVTKETSARVCDVALNIIDTLLEFSVIKKGERSSPQQPKIPVIKVEGEKVKTGVKDGDAEAAAKGMEDMTVHNLVMQTLIQVFRAFGCQHGCGEGVRGQQGDRLRNLGQHCLNRMYKIDSSQFRRYLRYVISAHPLESILDFMHALLGFCEDTSRPAIIRLGERASSANNPEGMTRGGFATNFGSGVAGTGVRGVEGTIVGCIFKALVSRLASSKEELATPENENLYSDVRQLLHYVREAHGGVFRRVALSGLIDSAGKGQKDFSEKNKPKTDSDGNIIKQDSDKANPASMIGKDQGMESGNVSPGTRLRRSLFGKKYPHNDSTLDDDMGDGAGKRRFSVFQFAQAVTTWRNRAIRSSIIPGEEGSPELSTPQPQDTPGRTKKEAHSNIHMGGRKKMEDHPFFIKFRKKSKRDPTSEDRDECETPKSIEEEEDASDSVEMTGEREKRPVNKAAVASGMKRLTFLMDCCNPGNVPDAEFLAAALDLHAPVVARAALFLECCHFVHRCNYGDWPDWMRFNVRGARGRGLSNVFGARGTSSCYRKHASLQRTAAKMFYLWAEAIGTRLEEIEKQESQNVLHVVGKVRDEGLKKRLRREDDEEDFLDEATVNPVGTACPHALKMVACQLLLEITSFLRETLQSLPKPRKMDRGGLSGMNRGARDSEFLEIPTVTMAPASPQPPTRNASGSSTTSSPPHPRHSICVNPSVDSPLAWGSERKISFALGGIEKIGEREKERGGGDDDSQHSSNTELNNVEQEERRVGMQARKPSRGGLLRRHGVTTSPMGRDTTARPTGRLRSSSRPDTLHGLARSGSIKGRKVSSISIDEDSTGETSSVFSDQVSPQEQDLSEVVSTPDGGGLEDVDFTKNMPWIPVVVEIASKSNFLCQHKRSCHPNCLERQKRNCYRLMKAVRAAPDVSIKVRSVEAKTKRKESTQGHSTLRSFRELRRESTSSTLDRQVSMFRHNATSRTNSAVANSAMTLPFDLERPHVEDTPIMKYLKVQAMDLFHAPLSLLAKAAPILGEELYDNILPLAWELLLDTSQQLAGSAAALVLICAVKIPETVNQLIAGEMHHTDAGQRVEAIQRFGVLWRFRHQVWPRMEDKASILFKVPPPSIDFTVPSPTIGVSNVPVLDPPWMPVAHSELEEKVSTTQESRSFAAVAVSRTIQHREHVRKTLLREQEKKRKARETFHLINVPVIQQAAYEPSHHVTSDDEDDTPGPVCVSVGPRRISIAPPAQQAAANLNRGRNLSIRRASLWSGGTLSASTAEDETMVTERAHHTPPTFGVFFPSSICSSMVHLTALLDDAEVNLEGVSVGEVAHKIIWTCLVEEPALILRYILEKITAKDKQEELILLMKKLFSHTDEIPAQAAHTLFNYLIGFIIYHCRAPHEGANEAIANTLTVIWHILPYVSGVSFKDLKQTLKKEQCDPTILITANVPCAKKLIVHGPNESDIPTQLPISEDMQFEEILQDCLEFFNIPPTQHGSHFLVDKKTNQMLDVKSYVRDFYAYRRSQCPELILKKMDKQLGLEKLQRQAFTLKLSELGRVYFSMTTLQSTPKNNMNIHVSFLHDELIRLPSFPRKALDAEFLLYSIKQMGRELFGLDVLHKFMWVKMTKTVFNHMSSDFPWSGDIQLFLNVINGALLLHCEDISILRLCLSTYINISRHFKHIFATKGFQYIMPTILRIYTHHQSNPLVCRSIEYVCRQFYILHMKPFILQLFGSAAPILKVGSEEAPNPLKASAKALFKLLLSLEKDSKDTLDLLELVDGDKPLKTLDFCYNNDPLATFNIPEAIRLCVVVVAFAPESVRSAQMLGVLDAIVPLYLQHLKDQTKRRDNSSAAKTETTAITNLAVTIKALVTGAETLARSTSGPSRKIDTSNVAASFKSSSNSQQSSVRKHNSRKSGINNSNIDLGDEDMREDFRFRYNDDRVQRRYEDDSEESETMNEFCKPRDMLLSVVSEFYCHGLARLKELRPVAESRTHSQTEILDQKCHMRIAEVALTLLKVAPHDPVTMGCKGLQRYITKMIPLTDWSNQDLRPALITLLKRLDKLFQKIHKKPTLMRHMDWESAANFLKGIYITLTRQSIISHLPHLKSLLNICLALLLCDGSAPGGADGLQLLNVASSGGVRFTPPPVFCSSVVRLVAMQMHCMKDLYTLEQVFGGTPMFNSAERTETILLYFVLPLCLRVGCGRIDSPKIRPSDISFALTMILNALLPPQKQARPSGGGSGLPKHNYSSMTDLPSHTSASYRDSTGCVPESLYEAGYLGLKIMLVCFQSQLAREWHRIATVVKELGSHMMGGVALWSFLDFLTSVKTPLYVLLKPFIAFKMLRMICETDSEVMLQRYIGQKLRGHHCQSPKSMSDNMIELCNELRHLRDNMFVPRDQVRFTDELVALAGERVESVEGMQVMSPFQQRSSIISRLTRKATITSRRSSSRQSSRRSSRRSQGGPQDQADLNANSSTEPSRIARSNSQYNRRSLRHTEECIAEADAEAEAEDVVDNEECKLGRGFTRRQNTKRISRSTSQRRHPTRGRDTAPALKGTVIPGVTESSPISDDTKVTTAEEGEKKENTQTVEKQEDKVEAKEKMDTIVHIGDALMEKFDHDEEETNEESRLLQDTSSPPTLKATQHKFVAMGPQTDTEEDDVSNVQETMRLLDLAKERNPVIKDRRGTSSTEDTHV